jgi:hypothetical protein
MSLFAVCGRANYTNLSRYSPLSERTFRRNFNEGIALEPINQVLIEQHGSVEGVQLLAVDTTFHEKSGRCTPDLDWFYNGKTQQVEKGLEWSVLAVIDLQQRTAYALSAQQTDGTHCGPSESRYGSGQTRSHESRFLSRPSGLLPTLHPETGEIRCFGQFP